MLLPPLAEHLGLVGLLAMETFITEGGLVFNEIAPRPHNSFHWTIEGTATSQFSQLVRAITGLPLGATDADGRWQIRIFWVSIWQHLRPRSVKMAHHPSLRQGGGPRAARWHISPAGQHPGTSDLQPLLCSGSM